MSVPMSKTELELHSRPRVARWHVVAGLALFHGYRKGVELGVSQGRFTSFLCATMHDMKMTAVDLWEAQPNNKAEGAQTYEDWNHEESYQTFKENCRIFFGDRVTIHRMDTSSAAALVEDGSQDFVFIDGDHSYEGCKRDILAWFPKVRSGGMITGHDYSDKWPMVKKAVDEMGWKIVVASDHVWIYKKP